MMSTASTQAADDLDQGIEGVALVAADNGGDNKAEVIDGIVQWVEAAMAKDRKVTALKTLQVGKHSHDRGSTNHSIGH